MLSLDFTEDDSPPIPALDGGEESVETIAVRKKLNPWKKKKKTGTGIKMLTPINLLTRLSILLAQAGNNSYKLKNEIRQIPYLFFQHNKVTKKDYNNLIKS